MCAYFLVILPLPSIETVSKMTTPTYNLIPFHFITEILNTTSFHVSDFQTYFPTMKNPVVYEAFFNIVLTVPFGIYLHYYFQLDFKKTFFYSFCFSLFFELTQLTGLYYIYPRSYRVFDVDDLILNTTGGVVGYFLAFILLKILPTREEIDAKSFKKGEQVTLLRRILTCIFDFTIYFLLSTSIVLLVRSFIVRNKIIYFTIYFVLAIFYYIVLVKILGDKTVMMHFLKLKFSMEKKDLKWYHLLFYYLVMLMEYIFLPLLFLIIGFILKKQNIFDQTLWEYYTIVVGAFTLFLYTMAFLKRLFYMNTIYEKISKITVISTLKKEV